jgi:hypothetical protein
MNIYKLHAGMIDRTYSTWRFTKLLRLVGRLPSIALPSKELQIRLQ